MISIFVLINTPFTITVLLDLNQEKISPWIHSVSLYLSGISYMTNTVIYSILNIQIRTSIASIIKRIMGKLKKTNDITRWTFFNSKLKVCLGDNSGYTFNSSVDFRKIIHNLNPLSSSFQESKCNLIMSMLEYSDCEWNIRVVEWRHIVAIFIITKYNIYRGGCTLCNF